MKVALIIERANIALGGAQRSVFELATALSAQDIQVTILAAKGQTKAKNINILCQHKPGKRSSYFTFSKALKRHLAENQYDIIHSFLPFGFADVYQPRGGSFTEAILRNAASYRNKFVQSYKRITASANFRRTILLQAEKKICKSPKGPLIAALSEYVARQFKQHYRLDNDRIVIVPNGIKIRKNIDTSRAEKLRTQILAQLGIKEADEPVLFLFVANNFRLKGLTVLIRAMHLAKNNPEARRAYLVVAGQGRSFKYRRMAKNLGVNRKIVFLGPIRHLQDALSIVNIAVLPTFYDPCSRYILEALAASKPVITTRFNGASEQFADKRHGKIIDTPENIPALAEAISYFTNTDNIEKASQAIIADNLQEKISINRAVKQLQALYNAILEKKGQK